MESLSALIGDRRKYREEIAELKKKFEQELAVLTAELNSIQSMIHMEAASLDLDKIKLAETVIYIYVSGKYGPYGDDQDAVNEAIEDIADGCRKTGYGHLRTEYFGTKNYGRWFHQGSNHEYGFGPRHGSIVFAIGLKPDIRKRLSEGGSLSEAERDAAIYYLLNLKKVTESAAASSGA